MNGRICSGPSEQLRPMARGLVWATAFQNASTFWAEIMVSPPSPTAAEMMTGRWMLSSSKMSWMATRAHLEFRASKMVSTMRMSTPPSMRERIWRL